MKVGSQPVDTKRLQGKKFLVIDDIPFCRLLPGMVLRPFGVEVHEFSGVREALKAVPYLTFDVVLLDLSMPEIDGKESLRMLKANNVATGAKIYAYTAYPEELINTDMAEFGFDGILTKPIKNQDLLNLLF